MVGVEGGPLGTDGVDFGYLVEWRFELISWDFSVPYAGTILAVLVLCREGMEM